MTAPTDARVGIFIDTDGWGGAEAVVLSCCEGLLTSDFKPVLLHFDNLTLANRCSARGIEVCPLPAHGTYKHTATLPHFAFALSRLLARQNITLLHSHLFGPVTAGAMAARLARIPHVGTLHDVYVLDESWSRAPLLCLSRALGTRFVTVSKDMQARYASIRCLRKADIELVPNGIELPPLSIAFREKMRKELGVAEHETLFVCVARFVDLKRHDLLLEACRLNAAGSRFRLLFLGDGPTRDGIEHSISRLGLEEVITIFGHSDRVTEVLRGADAFVLPSDTEGLSRSILEAMACGLPVIATEVGGNPELVREGETGLLIPRGDAGALAAAMRKLDNDRALRIRLGENGRKRAGTTFGQRTMVREYLEIYGELLDA